MATPTGSDPVSLSNSTESWEEVQMVQGLEERGQSADSLRKHRTDVEDGGGHKSPRSTSLALPGLMESAAQPVGESDGVLSGGGQGEVGWPIRETSKESPCVRSPAGSARDELGPTTVRRWSSYTPIGCLGCLSSPARAALAFGVGVVDLNR